MSPIEFFKYLYGSRGDGEAKAISCEEALRLVHEFIDGELDDVSAAEVEAHFEVCQQCYPHLRLERRFREALRRACGGEAAPAELRDRVRQIVAEERSDH